MLVVPGVCVRTGAVIGGAVPSRLGRVKPKGDPGVTESATTKEMEPSDWI